LSNSFIEKLLLAIRTIALDHALNFIDFTVDFAIVDKIAEFSIKEVLSDSKSSRHVLDCD
jgi:hypothetical protein